MSATATIEPAGARDAFRPTFSELLASEDVALLREPLRRWMATGRGRRESAAIVYEAWLLAGGEPGLIGESLSAWLALHDRSVTAQLLYKAWLTAGGDHLLVRHAIERWLAVHGRSPVARFVLAQIITAVVNPYSHDL
jgi:hypothetical protein